VDSVVLRVEVDNEDVFIDVLVEVLVDVVVDAVVF
jgi:hypothetical protein